MGQFSTQGFPPGAGGAAPTGALTSAEALPNGGYMAPNQGQAQGQAQGQWSINQVTRELIILRIILILPLLTCVLSLLASTKAGVSNSNTQRAKFQNGDKVMDQH